MVRSAVRAAGASVAFLWLAACESTVVPETTSLASVEINPPDPEIEVESTLQLEAIPRDAAGNPLNQKAIHWSSEDDEVATVSGSGVVTAVSLGSTRIAASSEGIDAVTRVTVVSPGVAQIQITPERAEIEVGESVVLVAIAKDRNGHTLDAASVGWSSEDETVATVDADGRVTGVGPGSTRVTATADDHGGTAIVEVAAPAVAAVSIDPPNVSMSVGTTRRLTAIARSAHDHPIEGRSVAWSSSRESVVTVSAEGVATAVTPGSATITATIDGVSGQASVSVSRRPVASARIAPAAADLSVGESERFSVTALASDGTEVEGRTVEWSSSDPSVVTVSDDGEARAVAPGNARISASVDGHRVEADVKVSPPAVARIDLSPRSVTLAVGNSRRFTAVPRASDGSSAEHHEVAWSSSDRDVITVSDDGLVRAVSTGTARVRAEAGGRSAEATVTVEGRSVGSVRISPKSAELSVGDTRQFTATARADDDSELDVEIAWSSTDTDVVTVSRNGRARAVAPGTARIRAEADGKTAEATVTVVRRSVESVRISPKSAELAVGDTRQFTATARADDDSELDVEIAWSSTDTDVVTVSRNGRARAVAPGTARIRAEADGRTTEATVTVLRIPVARVRVSPSSAEIDVGDTHRFRASVEAEDGTELTGRTVNWSSSQPSVATVDGEGTVTGVKAGKVTITATSDGKSAEAGLTVRARAAEVASVRIVSGDGQTGDNNSTLTNPLVVRVLDRNGHPVPGVEVRWSVSNGSISPSRVYTNAEGLAATTWTLGGGAPHLERRAWAEVAGLPRVEFTATRRR